MDTVDLVYKHPNPRTMAQGPRILDYVPPGSKKTEYYEPEEREIDVGGDKPIKACVYTVAAMYARRLLSAQPDRYFLLKPEKLIVPKLSEHGLRRENIVVKSILAALKEPGKPEHPEPEPSIQDAKRDQPPSGHAQGHPLRPEVPGVERPPAVTEGVETKPLEEPAEEHAAENPTPLDRPLVGEE